MKRPGLPVYALVLISLLHGPSSPADSDKLPLSLDAIFGTNEFANRSMDNIQWYEGEKYFSFIRINPDTGLNDIHEHNVDKKSERLLLPGEQLLYRGQPVGMQRYQWAAGHRHLLIGGPQKLTWDGRREAAYYVYDVRNKVIEPIAGGDSSLRNVHLSPNGEYVGYVKANNLYVMELVTGRSWAVTRDGNENIFNGFFDYGSTEFFSQDAWFWSPDSSKIAFWRLDATEVKVFYMVDELGKYNIVRPMKYPNTGEKHAVNRIGVYDLRDRSTTWMDIGHDADDYIPRIHWTRSSKYLAIQHLTRDHEKLLLWLVDTTTGKGEVIVEDADPAWVEITDDLIFLEKEDSFVWTSEKSGFRHAYLYDYEGREKQLTGGDWEITALIGLDEKRRWLYFYAKKESFIDQLVYRVKLDGGSVEKVSRKSGWYQWQLSPTGKYAVQTWSDARTPQVMTLRSGDGRKLHTLEANRVRAMENYAMPHTEFLTIPTSDGIDIDAFMIKPLDFDPEKKYPLIGYGYGNAGSQVVVNRWGTQRGPRQDLWHRYMAQQGYIVFAMDNRTTAGRGKKAKNLTYGHYAKWAVHDYLEGVDYLKTLPYVDASRLGFWGWSGGGYLAAALMTKGAPHFKTAVSVAPVIDLSRYQAVGVERWMGLLENNPKGYYETNLINYADRLQGDLLLIHGTGDENVKYAFTLQFADALIRQNKQFDMMIYPNQHHGIRDYQLHVFTKIADYFLEKL